MIFYVNHIKSFQIWPLTKTPSFSIKVRHFIYHVFLNNLTSFFCITFQEINADLLYTRFPQATTKLRPPYLGILQGLRKTIFRQFLLTLYVAVDGLSGRSKYQFWYQPTTSATKSPNLIVRIRWPTAGWICDPLAINPIKPRLRQGQPQVRAINRWSIRLSHN